MSRNNKMSQIKREEGIKTEVKTWEDWLKKWKMTKLKISLPYLQMELNPNESDKDAAWELYIELLTRITTQPLPINHGDEQTAIDSVYSIYFGGNQI